MERTENISYLKKFYNVIFDLYGIRRTADNENTIRKYRSKIWKIVKEYKEKNGLSDKLLSELSEFDREIIICYEVKDYMMEQLDSTQQKTAQKNLDNYTKGKLIEGEAFLQARNSVIRNSLDKKYQIPYGASENTKREIYKEYCQNVKDYQGACTPLSYEDFLKSPKLSIYDLNQNRIDRGNQYETTVRDIIQDIIQDIILEVLDKEIGLKIDISGIEKDLWKRDRINFRRTPINPADYPGINMEEYPEIDLSEYEYTEFPRTFEEYWQQLSEGREDEYTEKEKELVQKQYEEAKRKYEELLVVNKKLRNLSNYYKIGKGIQTQIKEDKELAK